MWTKALDYCPKCSMEFTQTRNVDGRLFVWCPCCEHTYEIKVEFKDIGSVPLGILE